MIQKNKIQIWYKYEIQSRHKTNTNCQNVGRVESFSGIDGVTGWLANDHLGGVSLPNKSSEPTFSRKLLIAPHKFNLIPDGRAIILPCIMFIVYHHRLLTILATGGVIVSCNYGESSAIWWWDAIFHSRDPTHRCFYIFARLFLQASAVECEIHSKTLYQTDVYLIG